MREKCAYHRAVAVGLVNAGRIEDAERHLDAAGILSSILKLEQEDAEYYP
jgi:hypothetical protein